MGRNHQQQKRNNTRGPCRFHTKWLWLVLAAAVMGAFGTLEAVTLAQDSVYREAMRPFPELVIASVLRVQHTHTLCARLLTLWSGQVRRVQLCGCGRLCGAHCARGSVQGGRPGC